ncbi:hypothetical protein BGZ63DRAFT_384415 [Mariannaea sp. PMI_226]|nr:hypothetical protein BGZ63DRAFT_384415 [Mariannaea sp. PMI_226]
MGIACLLCAPCALVFSCCAFLCVVVWSVVLSTCCGSLVPSCGQDCVCLRRYIAA